MVRPAIHQAAQHWSFLHSFPGFCRLRVHANKQGSQPNGVTVPAGATPVAFVEYRDVGGATQVMAQLQGSFLLSSDRGPIRIEYARSKMAMAAEVGSLFVYLVGHDIFLSTRAP